MGRGEISKYLGSETIGIVVAAILGLLAAGLASLLLDSFPSLGDTTELIAALVMGASVAVVYLLHALRKSATKRKEVGVASGRNPAVLLASLAGDRDGIRQLELDRYIRRIFGERIEVLAGPDQFDPGLGSKQQRDAATRDAAESWLSRTKCHVLLFGKTSGSGATHLSLFSKSNGVQELRGLSGEFLDLDEGITDQLAQHIAAQILQTALAEAGDLLGEAELDACLDIVGSLLPSVKAAMVRHSLHMINGTLLFEKGKREVGTVSMMQACSAYKEARDVMDPREQAHQWGDAQTNVSACEQRIGLRTGDYAMLTRVLKRLELDASPGNGLECPHCRQRAVSILLATRLEVLKKFWEMDDWQATLAACKENAERFSDIKDNEYWNSRGYILTCVAIGIEHLTLSDDLKCLADSYSEDALAIPDSVSRSTRAGFLGHAAVAQTAVFLRTSDSTAARQALELLTERLDYLSPDQEPHEWAETKANECVILAKIGDGHMTDLHLRKAVDAGMEAVALFEGGKDLLELARARNALGAAFYNLAKRNMTREMFEIAYSHYAEAAFTYARMKLRADWALCRMNMATAQCCLAMVASNNANSADERAAAAACFVAAERHAEMVVSFRRTHGVGHQLASDLANLAFIHHSHAKAAGDPELLMKAIDCCKEGLQHTSNMETLSSWRLLTSNLGYLLFELAAHTGDNNILAESRTILRGYVDSFDGATGEPALSNARALLDSLSSADHEM